MRTNIDIDDKLMEEAIKWSNIKSKKEIVNTALAEYIKLQKRQAMKNLQGKVEWIGDLDKMRTYDKWDSR
ncbi:MAG TPA: type II toxin-antitoxin system VapB family antitoxin [Hanamia sp.]|jgi:Arc/MetJ family transcription regulator|nr:type II toxin-antitoxin system VapB family antitoxin [Hanamia sp.]